MTILFISDLHLSSQEPGITEIFLNFLQTQASKASALYILGDFFAAWIGDDACSEYDKKIIQALKQLSQQGIPIYFMHGNRDFLIGHQFAQQTGCQLLTDPTVMDFYGTRTLLMHGDTLCINDKNYQRLRRFVRNPFWQNIYFLLPVAWRQKFANMLRKQNRHTPQKVQNHAMTDAVQGEILKVMAEHDVTLLIHGHTHRPCIEQLAVGGKTVTRIVLSDWGKKGNALVCTPDGKRELVYFDSTMCFS